MSLTLDDFADDRPWADEEGVLADIAIPDQIDGVLVRRLMTKADDRGDLTVLMSHHYNRGDATPHVYLVTAAAGSVRAWVYHKRQSDRLSYTEGDVRVVLYDIRPGSPTNGRVNVIDVGAANRVQLTIPPFVIHGVQNRGSAAARFVNMPTQAYDPARPDKSRIRWDHPGIPYRFER